jgi:hypothetical protein
MIKLHMLMEWSTAKFMGNIPSSKLYSRSASQSIPHGFIKGVQRVG